VSNPPAPGPVRERSAPNAATATAGTVPTESPAAAPPPAAGASAPPGTPPQHRPAKDASASRAAEAPVVAKPTETLRVDLERLDQLMNLGGELVINKARLFQIRGRLDTVFDQGNVGWLIDDVSRRIERLQADVEALSRSGRQDHALSGLSSGLGLLARDFTSVRTLADRVRACRPVMNDFSEALHSLGRVSDGIQRRIMETRMVAIGPLFQRFRRVVRDISKSTGKNIELVLHGEGTELDKRMIDELGDPLTHMIRNSVDHGIEPPEERLRQGKPAVAHVTLDAYHRGRHICIEVRDDGRGVNIEAVRRKILEKQLASPADVERTSDKDVVQYIFRPGFSTAEKVTDLSGRGMGMDIVISKLDALNGTVEVDSVTGVGTTVTIRLPLTLAIIQAILARVGEGVYAIPLESVAEIISVQPDAVQNITRRYVTRVRDRIIRIVFFEDVFSTDLPGMGARSSRERALTLVILSMQNDQVGLVVDGLIGQEEVVIKSISDNFRNVPGISGASIMGDGSVSLILDVASMFGMLAERGARRQDGSGVDGIGRPGSAGGVEVEVALAG
jgi:two-component system chemotaxis sensor kinase CheA